LSKIISIGTALPAHCHRQADIQNFMEVVFALDKQENRKLKFLYHNSGIDYRYSVIADFTRLVNEWAFFPQTENLEPFPSLEKRMAWFQKFAAPLSVNAINNCLKGKIDARQITHLITVSCTGLNAPGLDLQVIELLDLSKNIYRSSVNFMGCYAAIHALKMADAICKNEKQAKVMVVCTELCTLHFQKQGTADHISSSLLFGDGSAAVLVVADEDEHAGLRLNSFYSEILSKGKKDMAWELSSSGFVMKLSGYIPELIEEDFSPLVEKAVAEAGISKNEISKWCIHPGGKRILQAIHKSLGFKNGELNECFNVLKNYGNMSSPTILFVLKNLMQQILSGEKIFGAAFGPGLTMETFVATAT